MPDDLEFTALSKCQPDGSVRLPIHQAEADNYAFREPVQLVNVSEYDRLQSETVEMLGRFSLDDTQRVHGLVSKLFQNREHGRDS